MSHRLIWSVRRKILAIYAPMIYTAPCVMFLMRADTLRGQIGKGLGLEIESFLGPKTREIIFADDLALWK